MLFLLLAPQNIRKRSVDLLTPFAAFSVDGEMTTIAVPRFIENTEIGNFAG